MSQSTQEWVRRFHEVESAPRDAQVETLREFARSEAAREHASLREAVSNVLAGQDADEINSTIKRLATALEIQARAETASQGNLDNARARAKRILSEPQFRKLEDKGAANWLRRALDSLNSPREEDEQQQEPSLSLPTVVDLSPVFYGLVALLVAAAAVALFFFFRNWRQVKRTLTTKKVRRVGLLEEGEEALRADEWLARADELEARGAFREAIRYLYLAVLMRLDDAGIVRFDRYQTNWEHFRRIENSDAPKEVRYRFLTQEFDYIWYGDRTAHAQNCAVFRQEYTKLTERLADRAARRFDREDSR